MLASSGWLMQRGKAVADQNIRLFDLRRPSVPFPPLKFQPGAFRVNFHPQLNAVLCK